MITKDKTSELIKQVAEGQFVVTGETFTGRVFSYQEWNALSFEHCNFINCLIYHSDLRGADFQTCRFDKTTVALCDYEGAEFPTGKPGLTFIEVGDSIEFQPCD